VLPPIGGIKGKRDSKKTTGTFKTAGSSALQKQPNVPAHGTMPVHGAIAPHASGSHGAGPHPLGVLGTSKGFSGTSAGAGTSTSMSSQDAMSSTNPHSWAGTKDQHDIRGVSSGSGQTPVTEKMNSTWAPNHNHNQSRRYVSPFGAKMALGGGNNKKR